MTLSCTQLSAAFLEEFKLLSMEFGIPTVTPMLEPESAWRTSGSASKSLTLVILLAFKSSTTLVGGRGCDAVVPQFTPMARAPEPSKKKKRKKTREERLGGIRFSDREGKGANGSGSGSVRVEMASENVFGGNSCQALKRAVLMRE